MRKFKAKQPIFSTENSSVLKKCIKKLDEFRKANDLEGAKAYLTKMVENAKKVHRDSKNEMIQAFSVQESFERLDHYFWNALLKFEGLGSIDYNNDWF